MNRLTKVLVATLVLLLLAFTIQWTLYAQNVDLSELDEVKRLKYEEEYIAQHEELFGELLGDNFYEQVTYEDWFYLLPEEIMEQHGHLVAFTELELIEGYDKLAQYVQDEYEYKLFRGITEQEDIVYFLAQEENDSFLADLNYLNLMLETTIDEHDVYYVYLAQLTYEIQLMFSLNGMESEARIAVALPMSYVNPMIQKDDTVNLLNFELDSETD